jgi:hypothetical protein
MLCRAAEALPAHAENLLSDKENLSMADELLPTEGEALTTIAPTQPKPRTRSQVDTSALTQLALIELVAQTAQRPECVAPLAAEEITAAFVAQLLTDTHATQAKFARVITLYGSSKDATATEKVHHKDLLSQLTALNSAALRKWGTSPTHKGDRDTYGIGKKLGNLSRPMLETLVFGILQRVASDSLPGVTPAKIVALQSTYDAWKAADKSQATYLADTSQLLAEAKEDLKDLNTRRQNIQLAADIIWPSNIRSNAPLRTAFGIPKTRPFRPLTK